MRLHIVSDVHGASEDLRRAADGADVFICLGDLILFLDYARPERGIYSEIFGVEHTRAYIDARTANRFEDARELASLAWTRLGVIDAAGRRAALEERIRLQYAELFDVMPEPAFLTYGNVDVPHLWPQFLRPGHQVIDGSSVDIAGLRLGFVGGGLVSPMRTPFERESREVEARLTDMGPVDILFTHIPPAAPELAYDVTARRFEFGSAAISDYLRDVQPRYHFYGHVHQPLRPRARLGRTESVNVGHFAAVGRPFVVDV